MEIKKGRGGYRPGAGRKPKNDALLSASGMVTEAAPDEVDTPPAIEGRTPLEFLLSIQENALIPVQDRLRAAIAAAQYVHTKTHDGGKKDAKAAEAAKAGQGRFESGAGPLKRVA